MTDLPTYPALPAAVAADLVRAAAGIRAVTKPRPRIYLAGPISLGGRLSPSEVEANRARFREARERLTAGGWEVLDPTANGNVQGRSWLDWMRVGIAMLVTADQVLMLPGWRESRGARIEHRLAWDLGIQVDYQRTP